jgi:hypothetical protein
MILFLEDWEMYPGAIIDYQTLNKSAIALAAKYRMMSVKNNAFFLALHNPELQGVDPYSKTLTLQQMMAIGIECRVNPWYYFREIARAPAIVGIEPDMVEFNRANISMWWCFFNHITYILTQPRQTGKSFCVDLLMTELKNFLCNNTQINLLTKDDKLRGENIKRLKDIYEELPGYLNFKTREDANNTEELSIKKFGNTYKTHVPQMSPKRAYNLGRGMTTPIFQIDEAPFQPNIEIAMGSALAAMGAAVDRAKIMGEPYGILLTTTAGKKDDKDGKYIYNYAQDAAKWNERFLDAQNHEELKKLVCRNAREGAFRIFGSFTHTQLGKTDQWLKDKLEATGQRGDDANRDFFNIWTSGTQSSPLPTHILELLNKNIVAESYNDIAPIGGYITRWYIPETQIENYMANRKVIVGVDTSDASGGDDISFVGVDVENGSTVFVGAFNETNLITFSQWLVWFLVKYSNVTMIIERRSSGITIIDYLLMFLPQKGIDPFTRLFNWVINDQHEHKDRYSEAMIALHRRADDLYVRCKRYFGFATSGGGETSRSELYSTTLQKAAERCADKIKDRSLIEQITGLVMRNGRVDHDIGGHDDLVIGWLLAHWFLTCAKNLSHYGIDSKTILMESKPKENLTPSQDYHYREQLAIRTEIQNIFKKLSVETDPFINERLESQLRYLDSRIILESNEFFSIDALINQAKQDKTIKNDNYYYMAGKDIQQKMGYNTTSQQIDNLSSTPIVRY